MNLSEQQIADINENSLESKAKDTKVIEYLLEREKRKEKPPKSGFNRIRSLTLFFLN